MIKHFKSYSVLPGFGLSFGISVLWLTLMVILPLVMIVITASQLSLAEFWSVITEKRVLYAIKVGFLTAFYAIVSNVFFGVLVAWVLVRYDFWGKYIINALIDLPFALPTAVAGISLATIYSQNGLIGKYFQANSFIGQIFGEMKIAYTPLGIWIALLFISLPFIVRSVQPVLEELDKEIEEASLTLGAKTPTIIFKIILPYLYPALLTGSGMGFARATGEYGSVIFIAGNIPYVSEIAPLLIVTKLEQFDKAGASAIALLMLAISMFVLLMINISQWCLSRHLGDR